MWIVCIVTNSWIVKKSSDFFNIRGEMLVRGKTFVNIKVGSYGYQLVCWAATVTAHQPAEHIINFQKRGGGINMSRFKGLVDNKSYILTWTNFISRALHFGDLPWWINRRRIHGLLSRISSPCAHAACTWSGIWRHPSPTGRICLIARPNCDSKAELWPLLLSPCNTAASLVSC